jgi:hypothetical protein
MENEWTFCVPYLPTHACKFSGQPQVVLVQEACPITASFPQPKIAGSNPISHSWRCDQFNWKGFFEIANYVQRTIRGSIIYDN